MTDTDPRPWRLFIAIPMPEGVSRQLDELLGAYRGAFPDARWQRPDAFHVTLRFLGETDPGSVGGWTDHMARCADGRRPFLMATTRGDGVVRRSGGVAWLRIDEGATDAAALSGCLFDDDPPGTTTRAGSPAPPHLTVARRVDQALIDALAGISLGDPRVEWTADRLVLYRSHTGTAAGSRYVPLAEVPL
jgi:RNA 2',3'-cyclic 3'-phosphodiesterase